MFLKLFRKRSNRKYINKILNSKRSKISEKKIRSIGIILSLDEYKDYDKLREIFVDFGINEECILFAFSEKYFMIGSIHNLIIDGINRSCWDGQTI